jgi:tetratricopeptide (TPR) repeat protein
MKTMLKMKFGVSILALMVSAGVMAQSVQEGRRMLHMQRHHAAKKILHQLADQAPANVETAYWLAQAYFENGDPKGADAVLAKAMQGENGSHPLLLVAKGQAELIEGKTADARQRFETAISLTKAKNIEIFTAIGKANIEKGGDAAYGIEKLKIATALKGFKDPFTYIYMGDLYRSMMNGGEAVKAYENALMVDPKNAIAKHKIGKIYLTQGSEQRDIFLGKFNDAIADDPAFTPALYDLYVFYFSRDVYKATQYFNEYKKHAEPGPAIDYEEASLQFAGGDFNNAIAKADNLLSTQGDKADARLYRLKGYSYDKLGDSVKALAMMETFFQKATADQINPDNYVIAAYNAAKTKAEDAKLDFFFNKAIETDTLAANKVTFAKRAADFYKKSGNTAKSAEWLTKVLTINPKLSKVDLYNAGFENFKATEFRRADSIFSIYKTNYPDEVYGHYWSFRALSVIDSTMSDSLAIPDCLNFIRVAEGDKVRNKSTLITAYGYMAGFTANIKKDLEGASAFLDKIIEIDPNNQDAIKNREIIQKALAAGQKK